MTSPYQPYYEQYPRTAAPGAQPGAHALVREQPLVQLGDIVVTRTEVVTPSGRLPIQQAQLTFLDGSVTTQATPTWAVVVAVIGFFFFLLGLLFLLVKEERTSGYVTIMVTGPGLMHSCRLPVTSRFQVHDLAARVNHVNGLARSQS